MRHGAYTATGGGARANNEAVGEQSETGTPNQRAAAKASARMRRIRGQARRLQIFALIKQAMDATGQCPTAVEIAAAVGITPSTAWLHMRALRNATGLPMPIPDSRERNEARAQLDEDERKSTNWRGGASYNIAEDALPLDVLFRVRDR